MLDFKKTVEIDEQNVVFSLWWLLDEQISMMVPAGYYATSRREIKKQYPYGSEPDVYLVSSAVPLGVILKVVDFPLRLDNVEDTMKQYMRNQLSEGVSQMFVNGMLHAKGGLQIGFFDFADRFSPCRYQMTAILPFCGKMLSIVFFAPWEADKLLYYRQIGRYMLKSICHEKDPDI